MNDKKGLKISELPELKKLTGDEMLVYQDKCTNGRISTDKLKEFVQDLTIIDAENIAVSTIEDIVANEEDLTLSTNNNDSEDKTKQLKFADKVYNPSNYSGLGRVYLRKNIVGDKNILTQSMINKPNVRYIIQYDYDLNEKTINIPEGSILMFEGGSINNGTINCVKNAIIQQFNGTANITGDYKRWDRNYIDNEDITSDEEGCLKFADKEYNPDNFSGLGHVYLRKNIVDNLNKHNVLTQDMINKANTIYHIKYDYDLMDNEITIPENCVLKFEGGSLSNGVIICNNSIFSNYCFNNISFSEESVFDFIYPLTVPSVNADKFIKTILSHKSITSTKQTTFIFNSIVPYNWKGVLNINKKCVKLTGGGVIQGCIHIGFDAETYESLDYDKYAATGHQCIHIDGLTFNKYNLVNDQSNEEITNFVESSQLYDSDNNYIYDNISISLINATHVKITNCFFDNVPFPIVFNPNNYFVNQNVRRVNILNCDFERCNIGIYAPSKIEGHQKDSLEYGDLEVCFCNFFPYKASIIAYHIDGFKCYNNVMNTGTDTINYECLNMELHKCGQVVITNNSFYGEYNKCSLELIDCGLALINSNLFSSQLPRISSYDNIGCVRVINNSIIYSLSIQDNIFNKVNSLPIFINAPQNRGTIIDGNVLQDTNFDISKRTFYYINGGFIKKLQDNYQKETLLNKNLLDTRMDVIKEYLLNSQLYDKQFINNINNKVYNTARNNRLFKVADINKTYSITAIKCNNTVKYVSNNVHGSDYLTFLFNGVTLSIPFNSIEGLSTNQALNVLKNIIDANFRTDFDTYIISNILWIKSKKNIIDIYTPAEELTFNTKASGCFSVVYQNLGYNIEFVDVDNKPFFELPIYNTAIDERSNGKKVSLFNKEFNLKVEPYDSNDYNCVYTFSNYTKDYGEFYLLNDTFFAKNNASEDTAAVLKQIVENIYPDKFTSNGLQIISIKPNIEYGRFMIDYKSWYCKINNHVVKYSFITPDGKKYNPGNGEMDTLLYNDFGPSDQKETHSNIKIGFRYFDTSKNRNCYSNGDSWLDDNGRTFADNSGEESNRPDLSNGVNSRDAGYLYYDKTLNKPIWWTGKKWVDATGADV